MNFESEALSEDEISVKREKEQLNRNVTEPVDHLIQNSATVDQLSSNPVDSQGAFNHRKHSAWRLHCYGDMSKERVRRKLDRTKTTVEAHVCYPWLRRLVFHISHYFPNLHSSNSANRQRSHERPVSGRADSKIHHDKCTQSSLEQELTTGGRRPSLKNPSKQHSQGIVQQCTLADTSEMPQLKSTEIPHNDKRTISNRKRRPLQRQKLSGMNEFDQLFAKFEQIEVNRNDMSVNHSGSSTLKPRILKDSDFKSVVATQNAQLEHADEFSCSSSGDVQVEWNKSEPRLIAQSIDGSRATGQSTNLQKWVRPTPKRLSKTLPVDLVEQHTKGNEQRVLNVRDTVEEQSPEECTDASVRSFLPYHPVQEDSTAVLHRISSTSQPFIQYKRVKARRNSSNSQVDFGPYAEHALLRKTNEVANVEDGCKFLADDSFIVEDRGPVKAHVESWLEEAANITRQKQSRRRAQMYHLNSGDAIYESRPACVPVVQPHSLDVPVMPSSFDQHTNYPYTVHNTHTSGVNANPTVVSSVHQSSDSAHLLVPSLTIDSNESGIPYPLGESMEQEPGLYELHSVLNTSSDYPIHRRHSDNPFARVRGLMHASTSVESSASQYNTHSRTNRKTEQSLPKMALSARESLLHNKIPQFGESLQKDPRISMQFHEINQPNLIKLAFLRQSHSFSNTRGNNKSSIVLSTRRESVSSGGLLVGSIRKQSQCRTNPHNSLRNLQSSDSLGKSQCVVCGTGRHTRCRHRRFSQFAQNRAGQLSEGTTYDGQPHLLNQPISSAMFERRYSKHLKPMDAWQCRQSHSMELVQLGARGSSPTEKQQLELKPTPQRHLPIVYSRSMQQSTGSFPVPWCGFLSGPELSLASTLESTSITPDSQKNRGFFHQSTESGRSLSIHKPTDLSQGYSPGASPGMVRLRKFSKEQQPRMVHQDKRQQLLCTKLSPYSQVAETRHTERKAKSFELGLSFERPSQLTTQPYLMLPTHNSSDSSRRNSALSGGSPKSLIETTYQAEQTMEGDSSFIQPTVTTVNPTKLIPPDLIFSPASRRASIMEETETPSPMPLLSEIFLNACPDTGVNSFQSSDVQFYDTPSDRFRDGLNSESWSSLHVSVPHQRTELLKHTWKHGRARSANVLRSSPSQHSYIHRSFQEMYNPLESGALSSYDSSRSPNSVPTSIRDKELHAKSQTDLCRIPAYLPDTYGSQKAVTSWSTDSQVKDLKNKMSQEDLQIGSKALKETSKWIEVTDVSPRKDNKWGERSPANKLGKHPNVDARYVADQNTLSAEVDKSAKYRVREKGIGDDYLFRSTRDRTIDPELLQPSLAPVLDSSEENVTDLDNDESCARESFTKRQSIRSKRAGKRAPKTSFHDSSTHASEHHAARRRSFLAGYWQQAVQRSGDTSLDSFETLRTDTDS